MKTTLTLLTILSFVYHSSVFACDSQETEITSCKFKTYEELQTSTYEIPKGSRFTTVREGEDDPDIIYYLSKPKVEERYPITIFCTGSSTKEDAYSVIHVHRHLLDEFLNLGSAMMTLEQWGMDGHEIERDLFMAHYTRTQRLQDHQQVINALKAAPPTGWNGKFILLGVSEGGPIVTSLTAQNQDTVLATMNWCGAAGWKWHDEVWAFLEAMDEPAVEGAKTREEFDRSIAQILLEPMAFDKIFCSMSYLYHADSLTYPAPQYDKIKTPFLVVAGAQDSIIHSVDTFVQKGQEGGMDITYIRVDDMDHYIRKRPDILGQSFKWLRGVKKGAS